MVPTWPLYPEQYNNIINQSKLTPPYAIYLDICTICTFGVLKKKKEIQCELLFVDYFQQLYSPLP